MGTGSKFAVDTTITTPSPTIASLPPVHLLLRPVPQLLPAVPVLLCHYCYPTRVSLSFAVEHAKEVFPLLDVLQVAVAGTYVSPDMQRRANPEMHRVYSHIFDLYTTLHSVCVSLRVKADQFLHQKNAAGLKVYSVSTMQAQFQQHNMEEHGTRKAWMSFCFNGVVPPPQLMLQQAIQRITTCAVVVL